MRDVRPDPGKVAPSVALALLESLRAADTPAGDVPRESDLPLALRRRLGLTRVVEDQIRRYAGLRERDGLEIEEVARLFELIARRPDARGVFSEAGRRLADRHLGNRRGAALVTRALPGAVRRRLALRRVGRIAREVNPGGDVRVERGPATLKVNHCLPARALEGSEGCALITGVIERVMDGYRAGGARITHSTCEGRSGEHCAWELEPSE